ncbi:response regulator transcription factor [Phycicoccus sonneratiae]|uniref:Response regulator transcription factor n=1 Tax=Phycicoccus sonneratiae TaxID=2807628 RepID=A0ABS2CJI2_9MICO|nr:response regulator transcription factor [Phycicoccus sonneraticus]MBM6399945.1 response regulator transcription factor [Phycicoccus sonneraticus]
MNDPSARDAGRRVLLVEDDAVIGEATAAHLARDGFEVAWHTDGLEAWDAWRAADPPFDLVVSDVVLPGLDGASLTRRIRETDAVPVVLVSARTDSLDVVGGLEAGADDYVTKPFDVQVLRARLRNALRRAGDRGPAGGVVPAGEASPTDGTETFGDLVLDRRAVQLRRGEEVLALTPTEMRLFLELAEEPGRVLSRRALLERVWGYGDAEDEDHLVTVHVQRLRAKVGAEHVETVRGFGYRLLR